MKMFDDAKIYYERLASILAYTRNSAKISQAGMAKLMDISKNTVQNWENGSSAPDLVKTCMWLHTAGYGPIPAFKMMVTNDYNKPGSEADKIKNEALQNLDEMTIEELKLFNFIMSGNHGSSPYALLIEMAMNLMCDIGDRTTVACVVNNNYENSEATGRLKYTDEIQPDVQAFSMALENARVACRAGRDGYINVYAK